MNEPAQEDGPESGQGADKHRNEQGIKDIGQTSARLHGQSTGQDALTTGSSCQLVV